MASIIKNQILKHLSKFTKNLSPDKINLSTLKGEGEMSNLELDEKILMDLLDLPTWMRLTKAMCNKVAIKIQWTKLKSQPISLYLDEVVLEIETCEEPRLPNAPTHQSGYRSEGKYGFIDKVIDGIFVLINAVSVQFVSQKFQASLQLSRVRVESMTPLWCHTTDLRQSRIRSESTNQILLFKELDWQTTRIEATARDDDASMPSTPLRLIANQSKIRIVLKKKLSDCSIISSRVILLLDDILWVLTDTQLKSAILYGNSLSTMIEKSTEQSKKLAAHKLQEQSHMGSQADQLLLQQQQQQQQRPRSQTNEAKLFQRFDVATTSYHLITGRIDLHLCDDIKPEIESSPKHNRQIDGGAMQITFCKLSLDFYPFHPADEEMIVSSGGERKQWYRYTDNQGSRYSWVQNLFKEFRADVSKARETCRVFSPAQSPSHNLANQKSPSHNLTNQKSPSHHQANQKPQSREPSRGQGQFEGHSSTQRPKVTKLLESCLVVRVEEFNIYRVSTVDNQRSVPQKFFSSDKKALHLPADMSMVHIEYTDYFFTEGINYPVPHANLYVLVNPVRLNLDYLTILWANFFSLNLAQMVESQGIGEVKTEHLDVKIEALMPRVVLGIDEKVEDQPDRPDSIQIQISKLTMSNTNVEDKFLLSDLQSIASQYQTAHLFTSHEFPNDNNNMTAIPQDFHNYAYSLVNPYLTKYAQDLVRGKLPEGFTEADIGDDAITTLLKTDTLKRDARCDIWGVCVDQVWVEFLGVPTSRTRPVPFVESVPVMLWLCQPPVIHDQLSSDGSCSSRASAVNSQSPASQTVMSPKVHDESFKSEFEFVDNERSSRPSNDRLKKFYSQDSTDDESANQNGAGDSNDLHGNKSVISATVCDNNESSTGSVQTPLCKTADFNIIAKLGGKVRAQLNHYQYLFLMRLIESVTDFQTQLATDTEMLNSGAAATDGATFSVAVMIAELEFAMVCPYIAELLPLTHPVVMMQLPVSDSSEGKEAYSDTDSDVVESESGFGYLRDELDPPDQVLVVTQSRDGSSVELRDDDATRESLLTHSQSDTTIVRHTLPQAAVSEITPQTSHAIRRDSHSTDDVSSQPSESSNLEIMASNVVLYTASDSGLSSLGSNISGQRSRSNSKLTPTTVKKSFNVGVSNISSFMGKIKNKLDPDDISDDMDRLSVKTDLSSDDDFEFLALDDTELPAFSHGNRSETASSVDIDDLSSVFAESTSATKAKELVSTVVFRLSGSQLLLQGTGPDMFVRLQSRVIDTEESGNIVYEDFYARLSTSTGIIKSSAPVTSPGYPLRFKFVSGPAADREAPRGQELGFMDIMVNKYAATFNMSSILNMAAFIEDEKIVTPAPMHVIVADLSLVLKEDRPQLTPGTPSSEPVLMNIHQLFLRRYDDGVFHMTTGPPPSAPQPKPVTPTSRSHPSKTTADNHISHHNTNSNANITEPNTGTSVDTEVNLAELPRSVQEKITRLETQNQQLQVLLEQLDEHSRRQDEELDKYSKLQTEYENMKSENKHLCDKLKGFSGPSMDSAEDLLKVNASLENENCQMVERVVAQEDELDNLKLEKASLISTLHLLQDELMVSEHRYRKNTGSSSESR